MTRAANAASIGEVGADGNTSSVMDGFDHCQRIERSGRAAAHAAMSMRLIGLGGVSPQTSFRTSRAAANA